MSDDSRAYRRDAYGTQQSRTSSRGASRGTSRGTSRPSNSNESSRHASRAHGMQPQVQRGQQRGQQAQYSQQRPLRATSGGRRARKEDEPELTSKSVGEIRREERRKQAKKKSRRRAIGVVVALIVVAAVAVGGFVLYNSPAFSITNITVNGVEHLTSDEMAQLANVPKDSTLLRVDTDTIEKRIEQNAWVADAQVNRVFPDTLEINVTERSVFAVVEVPTSAGASIKRWAIADDHVWLMPIPDANSEAAKTTSSKIYEDAESVLHIVDVPYGTKAEIGQECTDANVNNALDIIAGLTTDLSGRVVEVSAAGTAETTLILDNGVEVAFGRAEDIRDKERVILQILADNPDNIAYINVRMVDNPTWRAV